MHRVFMMELEVLIPGEFNSFLAFSDHKQPPYFCQSHIHSLQDNYANIYKLGLVPDLDFLPTPCILAWVLTVFWKKY